MILVCHGEGWWVFLVCKFLADQEHLGAYAGAQNGNYREVDKLMQRPSDWLSDNYRKENRRISTILFLRKY